MIGYGEEDNHFVIELTYNYGIRNYKMGNDFNHIKLNFNKENFDSIRALAKSESTITAESDSSYELTDPNGYRFQVSLNDTSSALVRECCGVSLFVSDLDKSMNYWHTTLLARLNRRDDSSLSLSFGTHEHLSTQFSLELRLATASIDRGT